VLAVLAGVVHRGADVSKRHSYRLNAFGSGDTGPVAWVEEGALRIVGVWPRGDALGLDVIARPAADWPRVDIVLSHAGADGAVVQAFVSAGARGIVVAGTGNGTVHAALQAALDAAQLGGIRVLRATRCAEGVVIGAPAGALPSSGALSPVKARVALLLELLATA
jgi:L-asparaginase